MLRKMALIAAVSVGVAASSASAEPAPTLPLPLYGSDTMNAITTEIIANCGLGASITYKGGGSSLGGQAMGPGNTTTNPVVQPRNQQLAAQSRFLSTAECSAIGPNQGTGINVALDGLAIGADNNPNGANSCNTLRYSDAGNTPLTGFTFSGWRAVLRLLYAGQAPLDQDACTPNDVARTPAAPGNIIGRCDSQARKDLVASWGALFEGGCTNGKCPILRRVWRRDDLSGTTDAFLTLLGLPAVPARTFCNGQENEDLDPIRRPCDNAEQVCSNTTYANRGNANPEGTNGPATSTATGPASGQPGDLGLVLAVTLPTEVSKQYATGFCGAAIGGAFKYAPMPFATAQGAQRCPDGTGRKLGLCRWPVTSAGKFNCLAQRNNRPGAATIAPGFAAFDGRGYNQIPRDADTGAILLPNTPGINDPRWAGGGWFRIHQQAPMPNGTGTCQQVDATRQIGCLINSDPCSIGYAGREQLEWNNPVPPATPIVKGLNVRSPLDDASHPVVAIGPSTANVLRLLEPTGQAGGACGTLAQAGDGSNFGYRYPLARRLWYTASKGLTNVVNQVDSNDADTTPDLTTRELDLLTCIQSRGNNITDTAVTNANFIPIPAGAYPLRTCP